MNATTRRSLALALLVLASCPVRSATIDTFIDGPQEVVRTSNGEPRLTTAPPVALSNSKFTQRFLEVSYGAQRLAVDSTLAELSYSVDDLGLSGNARGYFELLYTSDTPVDLLAGGASAFSLLFESVGGVDWFIDLRVTGSSGMDEVGFRLNDITPGTPLLIGFDQFPGVDLGEVTSLQLDSIRIPVGTGFVLQSITTVPEPGPLPLFAGGGCAVLLRRRRYTDRAATSRPTAKTG